MTDWLWKKLSWFFGWGALAALFSLVVFLANVEIKDIDLWLHLAMGKHILTTFAIPHVDILSSTIAGHPWINHEWLFQTIVYSVYNGGGLEGLIILKVFLVTFMFFVLFNISATGEQKFLPILTLLLVLLVYPARMTLRPDMFSLLFFTIYIGILGFYLNRRWALWAIIFLQIIWSNMHGFFVFGPLLILIALTAECVKRHIRLPLEWNKTGRLSDEEYATIKRMLTWSILACLVNPYFIEGALYPLKVLFSLSGDSKIFFDHIQELQKPLSWQMLFSTRDHLAYRLLILMSGLSFLFNRRKIDINVLLLWIIFLVFSLGAVRNVIFFAFAAYFVVMANFQYLSDEKFLPVKFNKTSILCGLSIVCKVLFILWVVNTIEYKFLHRGYFDFDKHERKSEYGGASLRNYPYKAVNFLVRNNIKGNFFNDFNSGAYLLGRTFPNIKVFIDGRTEVYGAEFFKNYQSVWKGNTKLLEECIQKYQLTGAFLNSVYVPTPEKTIKYFYESPNWALVYFDHDATIFLRRDVPENKQQIENLEIDLNDWQSSKDLLKVGTHNVEAYRQAIRAYTLLNLGFEQKAFEEAQEALRIDLNNVKAYKLVGRIYNERGEYEKAFEYLRKAKMLDSQDLKVRHQMGIALYNLGEFEKAKDQCLRALAGEGKQAEVKFLLARVYAKMKEYAKSFEMLKAAHEADPLEIDEILNLAELFEEVREHEILKSIYALVLKVDPNNIKIRTKLQKMIGQ